jgi:hypothetical protein
VFEFHFLELLRNNFLHIETWWGKVQKLKIIHMQLKAKPKKIQKAQIRNQYSWVEPYENLTVYFEVGATLPSGLLILRGSSTATPGYRRAKSLPGNCRAGPSGDRVLILRYGVRQTRVLL